MTETAVVLNVHMQAVSGRERDLENQLRALLEPTRKEPGCLVYELHCDPENPGKFMFYEKFKSQAALDLHVVAFGHAVNADMCFCPARHSNGNLFAQEEIRVLPESFCGIDGVVVGQGNHGHPQPFQPVIDFTGIVVGFPANTVQSGNVKHARGDGVNM